MNIILLIVCIVLVGLAGLFYRTPEACIQIVDFLVLARTVDWIEWAKVFFDLIKGIAWPSALFIFAWFFRFELKSRIKDLVSAGPSGLQFQAGAQPTQPLSTESRVGTSENAHELSSVSRLIGILAHDIEEVAEQNRVPVLIRHLAEARVFANFEFIFGIIFASQIEGLRELKRQGPIPLEEAKQYYETEVRAPQKPVFDEWDFDKWSAFLLTQGLIDFDGQKVLLTDLGNDFILFVDSRKQGFVKPH
ncbi:hypothetical protein RRU01S_15_01130 [Agrobacterium rubi TR3 = NBRC 13261]|uniref:Uncharacterized protein n=1 Tax=Agrobacterium rubi TR3 = NBRC 13261 TaxID=1368415 RepID=A0A081CWZ2_9HYPH|nr:hypothetical protein [Agrobacterium rubi]MBP1878155.1 hypothetical protein [Agrobacterium rubi]GAK71188.1 hypothetical protein RRU01S_15_01130 [Agrobacterium rubi TR3 = NBRC 13261]